MGTTPGFFQLNMALEWGTLVLRRLLILCAERGTALEARYVDATFFN